MSKENGASISPASLEHYYSIRISFGNSMLG